MKSVVVPPVHLDDLVKAADAYDDLLSGLEERRREASDAAGAVQLAEAAIAEAEEALKDAAVHLRWVAPPF